MRSATAHRPADAGPHPITPTNQTDIAMFEHIDAYPGDPILTLNENFQKDPRDQKVNLSIGIYFDDDGRLPVMAAVREAEPRCCATSARSRICRWSASPRIATRCRRWCSAPITRRARPAASRPCRRSAARAR
jgi:hypothetical protein